MNDYILEVSYLKDPPVTLRYTDAPESLITERIDALTKEPSTVVSIEVYKREALLTRRTTWECVNHPIHDTPLLPVQFPEWKRKKGEERLPLDEINIVPNSHGAMKCDPVRSPQH